VLEGLTIHKSSSSNPCAAHMDSNNPDYVDGGEDSQLSLVVGASKWVERERVGVTGYFCKSLSYAMERKIKMIPCLKNCIVFIPSFRRIGNTLIPPPLKC
jgi:hypothetical protein